MKRTILFITCVLASNLLFSQAADQNLKLIPYPKQVEIAPGVCDISKGVLIQAGSLKNTGIEEFLSQTGTPRAASMAKGQTTLRLKTGGSFDFPCGDEGYRLTVAPNKIEIRANTEAGIFYGVQTLTQLVLANQEKGHIPCLTIRDYPDIPVRGWQDDISRGPIPTLDYLKKQVRVLSAFKLNAMTLYTEHVFKLKKHPTLAPPDGITQEQIAELSAYAARFHVQIIGNFQSFGHMEKILSKPGYTHLAEKGHILSPVKEESYNFLKEVYSEIVPAYSSRYFNINCDETFGLGEEASKSMADSIGIAGIYGYHINRLDKLLKPYNKQILMWGDIAADPEITRLLPRDITVISWGYHDAPSFDYAIKPFADQHLNFWVAPGTSCWGNIFPNFRVAEINIRNYIRDGYKLGATGVLNTTWDDDGLTLFENNWWPLVYGAENSWNPTDVETHDYASLRISYDKIFFGASRQSVLSWMHAFSGLHQSAVRGMLTDGRMMEPVMLFYPEYVEDAQLQVNSDVLGRIDSLEMLLPALEKEVVRNREVLDYLKFALAEARFTANKNIFRVQLYKYIKGTGDALPADHLKSTLKWLIRESERLKEGYVRLWSLENRNWWLDRNLAPWDRLTEGIRDIRGVTLLDVAPGLKPEGREIRMRSVMDNLPVYYTLDGTEPTMASARFTGPVFIQQDATTRARVIAEGRNFPETADSLIMHKAIGKITRLNSAWSPYHPAYAAGGASALADGRTGSVKDIRSGRWQGFSGQNIDVEFDLGAVETLHSFSMGFYQHTFSWVILPKQVEIHTSSDGIHYQLYTTIGHTIPVDWPDPITHEFTADLTGLSTRYLKVVAVYFGPLPEFHASKGEQSMVFADEIELR
jgi:hypothetical protein